MAIATARHKHKQHIIEKFIFFKNLKTFMLFKTIHTRKRRNRNKIKEIEEFSKLLTLKTCLNKNKKNYNLLIFDKLFWEGIKFYLRS